MIQRTNSFIFYTESSQGLHQVTDCPDLNFTLSPPLLTSPSAPLHLTPTHPQPHHLLLLSPHSALAHLLWKTKSLLPSKWWQVFPPLPHLSHLILMLFKPVSSCGNQKVSFYSLVLMSFLVGFQICVPIRARFLLESPL